MIFAISSEFCPLAQIFMFVVIICSVI